MSSAAGFTGTSTVSSSPLGQVVSRHSVVKSSWKGRIGRIFCVHETGVSTTSTDSFAKYTNSWSFQTGFHDARPDSATPTTFTISVSKNGASAETMHFTCTSDIERTELLTTVQLSRHLFDIEYNRRRSQDTFLHAQKLSYTGTWVPVTLRATAAALQVLDPNNGHCLSEYQYAHIKLLTSASDVPYSLVVGYGPLLKLHLFTLDNVKALVQRITEYSAAYVGVPAPTSGGKPITRAVFDSDRYGLHQAALIATEEKQEFHVNKITAKHNSRGVRRVLHTSTVALVERDPVSYTVVSGHMLSNILALVRCVWDEQRLEVVLREPYTIKVYTSLERDTLLAHLLDCCHRAGASAVTIWAEAPRRCWRLCSFRTPLSPNQESFFLGTVVKPAEHGMSAEEALEAFNTNVDVTGLRSSENREGMFSENREQLISLAYEAALEMKIETTPPSSSAHNASSATSSAAIMCLRLDCLRRLTAARVAYSSVAVVPKFSHLVGGLTVTAFRMDDSRVALSTLQLLCALMTPQHNNYSADHEAINRNRVLGAANFIKAILLKLRKYIHSQSSPLVVMATLQFFVLALCPPFSESTSPATFESVMSLVVQIVGRDLFLLLSSPVSAIRTLAGQLQRVIMEEGTEEQFTVIHRGALSKAGILLEFNQAAFGTDRRQRDLARRLLAYWAYGSTDAQDLLRRMVPLPLLVFLQSSEEAPDDEQERGATKEVQQAAADFYEKKSGWFKKSFEAAASSASGVRGAISAAITGTGNTNSNPKKDSLIDPNEALCRFRHRNVRVQPSLNWNMLFYQLKQDHERPDLIWNRRTRDELRQAIEKEIAAYREGVQKSCTMSANAESGTATASEAATAEAENVAAADGVAWNYAEFEILYHSLDGELKVGKHYPRLLFEDPCPIIDEPREFFFALYHRFLLLPETSSETGKMQCLQGMALLYKHYAEEVGEFGDLPFFVRMLRETSDPVMRDRLLQFFQQALKSRYNMKLFVDADGLAALVENLTLAQLHVDRPQLRTTTTSTAIEGSSNNLDQLQGQEKEWYYTAQAAGPATDPTQSRAGPVSFLELKRLFAEKAIIPETKVWAQGMAGWTEMRHVPQLRWGICYADRPTVLTFTEVTTTVLDVLLFMCEQYPSRDADGAVVLPLPRVKRLLSSGGVLPHIVQLLLTFDSAVCSRVHLLLCALMQDNPEISRLYLTGVFFFSLMYNDSSVLSMCKLLHLAHNKQAFRYNQSSNDLVRRSVLAPMLPPAMICYLTNHGPEEFAKVLLGDFETPEAIWGKDMRVFLSGKIAAHVAEFTPRLLGNNLAVYQYCPIAPVVFEPLADELFCGDYYLSHFCDEARYPDWPVRDPVGFVRDALALWRAELDKKPSSLTRSGCLAELELSTSSVSVSNATQQNTGESPSAQQIRRAYLALASRYHPDKNPQGRDKFERVQQAYEYLISSNTYADRPNPEHIRLLLKAQSLLYRRFSPLLSKFKYAGYGLLLKLIRDQLEPLRRFRPAGDDNGEDTSASLCVAAVNLVFHTVQNVALNADELGEEGGIELLCEVAVVCFERISTLSVEEDTDVVIATACMRTLAVAARISTCAAKLRQQQSLLFFAVRCVAQRSCRHLVRACLSCCSQLLRRNSSDVRTIAGTFYSQGLHWHLLIHIFNYDPTMPLLSQVSGGAKEAVVGATTRSAPTSGNDVVTMDEAHHTQLYANKTAVEALGALAYLLAALEVGDASNALSHVLTRLLSGFIMRKVKSVSQVNVDNRRVELDGSENETDATEEILRLLNTNSETPYFLWSNATRRELLEIVEKNSKVHHDTPPGQPVNHDALLSCDNFEYTQLRGELVVDDVIVRLYLEQPSYPIENPARLFTALLHYLGEKVTTAGKMTGEPDAVAGNAADSMQHTAAAAAALSTVTSTYVPAVKKAATAFHEHFIDLLTPSPAFSPQTVKHILVSFTKLCSTVSFVETVVKVAPLFLRLARLSQQFGNQYDVQSEALTAMSLILDNGGISAAQLGLRHGLHVFFLHLAVNTTVPNIRECACACLSRLFNDRAVGPKVLLACARFVPTPILEQLQEGSGSFCLLLDGTQHTPELLWNGTLRRRLARQLVTCVEDIVGPFWERQRAAFTGPSTPPPASTADYTAADSGNPIHRSWSVLEWTVPAAVAEEQARVAEHGADEGAGDLCVAGVYLNAYLASPNWAVRRPREFLLALLDVFLLQCTATGTDGAAAAADTAKLVTSAAAQVLGQQPSLSDSIIASGYGQKLLAIIDFHGPAGSREATLAFLALQWLHLASRGRDGVNALLQQDPLKPLLHFLERYPEHRLLLVSVLVLLVQNAGDRTGHLVRYALDDQLIEILLTALEQGQVAGGGDLATVRAVYVKCLKQFEALPESIGGAAQVRQLLATSTVWDKYKHQSHDLFLQGSATQRLLTGSADVGGNGPGGSTGNAAILSLTSGAAHNNLTEPPPLDTS